MVARFPAKEVAAIAWLAQMGVKATINEEYRGWWIIEYPEGGLVATGEFFKLVTLYEECRVAASKVKNAPWPSLQFIWERC